MSLIDALSRNDLEGARAALLQEILDSTSGRASWDCPHYMASVDQQKAIRLEPSRNARFTYFGLENLRDRYFLRDAEDNICEDPQTFFARVAVGMSRGDQALAQELYDAMSKGWFLPATPVLMNIGTSRGLPISCYLNTVPDTLEGIFDTYRENAFLSKYGGGIGTDWSQLRGQNAPLQASGLRSSGVIPFLKIFDSETIAISRNSTRRGAAAAYLRIDHPDIEDFLEIRKPTGGDQDRRCLNLHHAVVITDAFMHAVEARETYALVDPHYRTVTGELDALTVWRKLLSIRVETGEPYFLFVDTANRAMPEHQQRLGLQVRQSNLCSEIVEPTDNDRTAVCCLGSLNLETYEEWRDRLPSLTYACVKALDNNLDTFCEQANPQEYRKAIYSVQRERAIGLGIMGYHGALMQRGFPFESVAARSFNKHVFKAVNVASLAASRRLAEERGLPEDGGTQRNSYVMSLQPTASTAFLCGEATPSIEPISGNAYMQKTLSGTFLVKNRYFAAALERYSRNTEAVWASVIEAKGSVQHLTFLSEEDKKVFRTAYEMNMREIVEQAADRQPYICQAQSLNLFFSAPVSGKYLDEVHRQAWKKGLKTLYYLRSEAPGRMGDGRNVATEECAVCQ